jgi:glutamyl-tRNA reductase
MAGLTVATLARRGADEIVVVNRTPHRAHRLAEAVDGRGADWSALEDELAAADLVVSCTGATGVVVSADVVARARRRAGHAPCVVIDLALPRDVDPAAAAVAGLHLLDLSDLAATLADCDTADDVREVRAIVSSEVAAFVAARSAARVTPTVVALRSMATDVVDAELARLRGRVPELAPEVDAELARTVRRVADKLLHEPTVRIKELAERPGGESYADALTDLFSLDQSTVDAVTCVAEDLAAGQDPAGEDPR